MASVFHLCNDAFNIKRNIVQKYSDFSETDKKLYFSAVAIQRSWKGYVVRKMIKHWNKSAITLQRFIRGWLARIHLPQIYESYYSHLSMAYYNKQATKIQSLWRGYYARKTTVSVKSVLADRTELELVSKEMQEQMRNLFEAHKAAALDKKQQYVEKILMILFERHHLLRTRAQEGIFSIHGSYELSCVEKILKSFRLKQYMKDFRAIFYPQETRKNKSCNERKEFDLYSPVKPEPYERMLVSLEEKEST